MPESRLTANRRGYDGKWRKDTAAWLKLHPWCEWCKRSGIREPATVVHHDPPHRGDLKKLWDRKSWVALCKRCHDSEGQRQDHGKPARGCDAQGNPLDPKHPWYVKEKK